MLMTPISLQNALRVSSMCAIPLDLPRSCGAIAIFWLHKPTIARISGSPANLDQIINPNDRVHLKIIRQSRQYFKHKMLCLQTGKEGSPVERQVSS